MARASSTEKRQVMRTASAVRAVAQALTACANVAASGMRRARHCRVRTDNYNYTRINELQW